MKTGRSRKRVPGFCTAGLAETINIDWVAPFNCTVIQMSCNYIGAPGAVDIFEVGKVSVLGPPITPLFRTFDMGAEGWQEVLCNEDYDLMKGDHLIVEATNDNDLDVGVEIILEEGG